jgi:hypothetical protein
LTNCNGDQNIDRQTGGRFMDNPLNINEVIANLLDEWNTKNYQPLLEADVSAWIFHFMLMSNTRNINSIHLESRIPNLQNKRFDIAAGKVQRNEKGRPYIEPELIIEIKLFPRMGFTSEQNGVHFKEIINRDIEKLSVYSNTDRVSAYSMIVDGSNYLNGTYKKVNRLKVIREMRDDKAPSLKLCIISFQDGKWIEKQY